MLIEGYSRLGVLKDFEIDALMMLGGKALVARQIRQLSKEGELVSLDFSGKGYFLTLRHNSLPNERVVFDQPIVTGTVDGLLTGFVAFVENGEVTLDCFAYGDDAVPQCFRDLKVQLT